jgi:ABC-type Zn uptake system ZnuABC Zn-binding protein ZnuA
MSLRTAPPPAPIGRRRLLAGVGLIAGLGPFLTAPSRAAAGAATPTPPASSLGWSDDLIPDNGKLNVVTTVAPLSSIVRNVGGEGINLRGIVPDDTNSHTFEPAPSDAVLMAAADVVIVNGLDLELPTMELATANLKPGGAIVSLGDQTITESEWRFDFSFPVANGRPNPHLWTNVTYAITYAELAAATLRERDPDLADYFAENLERYWARLTQLDEAIFAAVATVPAKNRKLLTYHDSWAYFAPRYGMTVIGAAQPSDFSEPSPREVASLITQIREEGVPAVFGSEVFPSGLLEQIADEAGAVYIDGLRDDAPPGAPGDPEHTYVGMMRRNIELMIPALGGSAEAVATIEPYDTFLPLADWSAP